MRAESNIDVDWQELNSLCREEAEREEEGGGGWTESVAAAAAVSSMIMGSQADGEDIEDEDEDEDEDGEEGDDAAWCFGFLSEVDERIRMMGSLVFEW